MIAHIVLFTPKPALPADELRVFTSKMTRCFRSIDAIDRVLVGRRTDIDAGYARSFGDATYEYAALLEFHSRTGLIEYLQHPLHHELGRMFWESCERTVISEVELHDGRDPAIAELLV